MCCLDFIPIVSNKPPTNKKNRTGLIIGIVVGIGVVSFLSVVVVLCIIQRRKRHTDDNEGKKLLLHLYYMMLYIDFVPFSLMSPCFINSRFLLVLLSC